MRKSWPVKRSVGQSAVSGGSAWILGLFNLADLFLALSGDRFDGHDFVATALSRGAMGVIVLDSYDVSCLP